MHWRFCWPLLLAVVAALALVACDDGAAPSPTPTASPPATPPLGIGSYADPYDFHAFAVQLAAAIAEADVQFFLDNVTFTELSCVQGLPSPPPSCAGQPPDTSVLGIPVGVFQSEGFGLDAVGYEEFVREFLTSYEVGASDAYGDAKPLLYAYAIFRPQFELPSTALETIQAIATRIVPGPEPRFPPPGRGVLLFGTSFDGPRWSITHLATGPSVGFLDPISPEAVLALGDVFQFWARWEGSAPATEAGGMDGFRAFAAEIEGAIVAIDSSLLADRALPSAVTCIGQEELGPCVGQVAGTVEGLWHGIWRTDAADLVSPEQITFLFESFVSAAASAESDAFGSGEATLYAIASSPSGIFSEDESFYAILTAMFSGLQGPERRIIAYQFAFRERKWKLVGALEAGGLFEEWLSGQCAECYDQWERWEG